MALPDQELSTALQDDEKVWFKIGAGVDSQGQPANWRSVPAIVSADPSVIMVDQTSMDPNNNPQVQDTRSVSGWLVGKVPGTTDVRAELEVDVNPGADQNIIVHAAVGGGDSTGAAVELGTPVKQ